MYIKLSVFSLYTLLLIVTLLFVPFTSGCVDRELRHYSVSVSGDKSNYETFVTAKESIPQFSFEYPTNYIISDQTKGINNPALYLGLKSEASDNYKKANVKSIEIWITNYYSDWLGLPDSKTAMNNQISEFKWSFYRNFKLVEKHKAVVNGIEGWETVIFFRERPSPHAGYGEPRDPIFVVARDLFFDYQGMTWHISLYTDKYSYEKQTKSDFEHILQTFKFPK